MSRRINGVKDTPLNQEFARLGLVRVGQVAHQLGVDQQRLRELMQGGALKSKSFQWGDKMWSGVPVAEVERIKAVMEAQ